MKRCLMERLFTITPIRFGVPSLKILLPLTCIKTTGLSVGIVYCRRPFGKDYFGRMLKITPNMIRTGIKKCEKNNKCLQREGEYVEVLLD